MPQDLIVTLDDATGHITSIFLAEQEGTMSSLRGLSETISGHGLFGALYTDRGSHYFLTPDAGGRMDVRAVPGPVSRLHGQTLRRDGFASTVTGSATR